MQGKAEEAEFVHLKKRRTREGFIAVFSGLSGSVKNMEPDCYHSCMLKGQEEQSQTAATEFLARY